MRYLHDRRELHCERGSGVKVQPQFVESIPESLEDGKLYISRKYATAVHKCCCGCGNKVVTPLSPTGWSITIDGPCVSLYPSIGNWSFPCRSHYFIRRNTVVWSYVMSQREIEAGRRHDAKVKERYFETGEIPVDSIEITRLTTPKERDVPDTIWKALKRWFWGT